MAMPCKHLLVQHKSLQHASTARLCAQAWLKHNNRSITPWDPQVAALFLEDEMKGWAGKRVRRPLLSHTVTLSLCAALSFC